MFLFLLIPLLVQGNDCNFVQWNADDISKDTILERLSKEDKPILIKGALNYSWSTALEKWDNYTYFKEKFGDISMDTNAIVDEPVEVAWNGPTPSVGNSFTLNKRLSSDKLIFERQMLSYSSLKHFETDLNEIIPDLLQPLGFQWHIVSIGNDGTGLPPHKHSASWLGLVKGEKKWFVSPPEELTPAAMLIGKNKSKSTDYDLGIELYVQAVFNVPSKYSKELRNDLIVRKGLFECVQRAGDIIFIPHLWWHSTENVGNVIGLGLQSQWFHKPELLKPKRPYLESNVLSYQCNNEPTSDWSREPDFHISEDCHVKIGCKAWELEPFHINFIKYCTETHLYSFFEELNGYGLNISILRVQFKKMIDFLSKTIGLVMRNMNMLYISHEDGNHIIKRIKIYAEILPEHITSTLDGYKKYYNLENVSDDWFDESISNDYKNMMKKMEHIEL